MNICWLQAQFILLLSIIKVVDCIYITFVTISITISITCASADHQRSNLPHDKSSKKQQDIAVH